MPFLSNILNCFVMYIRINFVIAGADYISSQSCKNLARQSYSKDISLN